MKKKQDSIYCVSWSEAEKVGPIDFFKQLGVYREDANHLIIDFTIPINFPQPANQTEVATIQRVHGALNQVAQQGFRYVMVYEDEFIKVN